MMRLLETINIIYNMEFIIVKVIYKGILKLVLLFQTLQLIAQGPLQVSMKTPKIFTNKSPWGMKTHGNMCCWCPFCRMHTTQPKGTSPCEQAQSKKPQQEAED